MNIDEIMSLGITDDERVYAFWLHAVPWIGQGPVPAILNAFGSPREAFLATDEQIITVTGRKSDPGGLLAYRKEYDIFEKYDEFLRSDMKVVFAWEKDYPARLRYIPDPPLALFYLGRLPENNKLSVAVIGARQCSEYGELLADELGSALGENDVNVISGMAFGIDGISQNAAVSAGGSSFAVLGCGADICYPDSNYGLYEKLKASGGILSAYPPKTPALARYFPPRNRIVSGLSDAVVVLEARTRSGTFITVDMALEQGRDIYAAPGNLTYELSSGTNGLIGHGARIYLSPEIFMADLFEEHASILNEGYAETDAAKYLMKPAYDEPADLRHRKFTGDVKQEPRLEKDKLEIYKMLSLYPQSAEDIDIKLLRKKIDSPGETGICLILMELCLEGYAVQVSPGQFCRKTDA